MNWLAEEHPHYEDSFASPTFIPAAWQWQTAIDSPTLDDISRHAEWHDPDQVRERRQDNFVRFQSRLSELIQIRVDIYITREERRHECPIHPPADYRFHTYATYIEGNSGRVRRNRYYSPFQDHFHPDEEYDDGHESNIVWNDSAVYHRYVPNSMHLGGVVVPAHLEPDINVLRQFITFE
jgi:hypothetical protein